MFLKHFFTMIFLLILYVWFNFSRKKFFAPSTSSLYYYFFFSTWCWFVLIWIFLILFWRSIYTNYWQALFFLIIC